MAREQRSAILRLAHGPVPSPSGAAAAGVDGVVSVHDLHVWSLSSSRVALSAHVVVRDLADWPAMLARLRHHLSDEFAIDHVTLQPEVNESRIDPETLKTPHRRPGNRTGQ